MTAVMSVSMNEGTNEADQERSQTAEPKSPDLSKWQSFRLSPAEKERLANLADQEGVTISTLLRRLISGAS
jgi:hypothetical protein